MSRSRSSSRPTTGLTRWRPACARYRGRARRISRSSLRMTARERRRAMLSRRGPRTPAFRCIMCGRRTAAFVSPKSAIARSRRARAGILYFWMATASRDLTSSRRTARSPNPATSSGAIAHCCPRNSPTEILGKNLEPEDWSLAEWARLRARGEVNRLMPLARLPLGPLRKRLATEWEGVRGGNFAFFRDDLDRVDGFETSFTGWGLEDSDIVIRMIRSGVAAQGRALRDGRAASVASGGRPRAASRQPGAAR